MEFARKIGNGLLRASLLLLFSCWWVAIGPLGQLTGVLPEAPPEESVSQPATLVQAPPSKGLDGFAPRR